MTMTFEEIYTLHQSGDFAAAKKAYLDFLEQHPEHGQAWHLLGMISASDGDYAEAVKFLEKALALDDNSLLRLHLANAVKSNGDLARAKQLLRELLDRDPTYAAAYNNLGTLFYAEKDWVHAIEAYHQAIDAQPNFVDAYYNLGLAFEKNEQFDRAMMAFQSVLELSPAHAGSWFHLALIYMQQNDFSSALNYLSKIAEAHPFHFETQSNLGACYLRLGNLTAAKDAYLRAYELNKTDLQVLFNLGVIEMQQSNIQTSESYYLQAVSLYPDSLEAHHNLAVIYLAQKNRPDAIKHFCEVLRLQPHYPGVQHTIDILNQRADIHGSPPEYIQSLFDSYADHYDAHLLGALAYQVPQLLHDKVKKYLHTKSCAILDIGAGTGLSGAVFAPYANRLVGIDLSEKMLAVAAQKHLYDDLIQSDIIAYLKQTSERFDLVVAADVIVYFGDLAELMEKVAGILRSEGIFVFNAEMSADQDYALTATGRFVHHVAYIKRLAAEQGLTLLSLDVVPLRKHLTETVQGYLFVLQRPA